MYEENSVFQSQTKKTKIESMNKKEVIKDFIAELNVYGDLCKKGLTKYAENEKDRVIETFKEALSQQKQEIIDRIMIEMARQDFKAGRIISRKQIMKLLDSKKN